MQVSFYGKTYSFNTKQELYRVMDEIYYYAQDKEKELIRDFDDKKEKAIQKLRKDAEDMYRKLKDKESDLKNSKGEDMSYYAKLAEKKNSNISKYAIYKKNWKTGQEEQVTWEETTKEDIIQKAKQESRWINHQKEFIFVKDLKTGQIIYRTDLNNNSKEKSNSVVTRGTIHGHKYEVERVDYLGQATYIGYVYDKEGNTILKTNIYMKAGACEQEIKSKVFNSKENWKVLDAEIMSYSDPDTHERYYKVWLVTDEGWRNPRVFKTFQEADREAARIQREVKSQNSKENSMNYYEKIAQEKKNDSQVIERGTVKGVKYFIEKITGYKRSVYRGNLEKDGRVVTSTWTCDTIDECKREINKLRDTDALLNNSKQEKSHYQSIVEKKNALPEFKYCYQAMQWFKEGGQYAEVIDKLVDRFHLDKSTAAAAAQKGQQMYEDSYRNK